MARKPKKIDQICRIIWNFPIKSCMVLILGINISMFFLHRLIMFIDFYTEENNSYKDDLYVNNHICQNNTLKANLGSEYVDICHKAEQNSQKYIFLNAFRRTINNTYLCGDIACIELFEIILEIVTRSLAWTFCAGLFLIICVLCLIIYCVGSCGGSRKWKRSNVKYVDLEHQYEERTDFNEPLRIMSDNFENYKKNI